MATILWFSFVVNNRTWYHVVTLLLKQKWDNLLIVTVFTDKEITIRIKIKSPQKRLSWKWLQVKLNYV